MWLTQRARHAVIGLIRSWQGRRAQPANSQHEAPLARHSVPAGHWRPWLGFDLQHCRQLAARCASVDVPWRCHAAGCRAGGALAPQAVAHLADRNASGAAWDGLCRGRAGAGSHVRQADVRDNIVAGQVERHGSIHALPQAEVRDLQRMCVRGERASSGISFRHVQRPAQALLDHQTPWRWASGSAEAQGPKSLRPALQASV